MKSKLQNTAIKRVSPGMTFLALLFLGISCLAQFKEEFRKVLPLSPNGQFRLSNVNGEVVIRTWEQPSVQIIAIKEAASAELLAELKIEVRAVADSVEVETIYPKGVRNGNFSAKYNVTLPKTVVLKQIETVNGNVDIEGMSSEVRFQTVNGNGRLRGCSGRVDGQTVNGGLDVEALAGQNVADASLKTVNGSIKMTVPDLTDVRAEAETVNGSIQTDFPFEVKKHLVGKEMSGSLGSGKGKIQLETVNGSIRLVKK